MKIATTGWLALSFRCCVNNPVHKSRLLLVVALACGGAGASADWRDPTAGMPLLQNISAKELGGAETKWTVTQDRLGRIFVGGDSLEVFDGQSWRSFPVPHSYGLRALAQGTDGRMWAGAVNEVGYFSEETLGVFTFHSLAQYLPKEERLVGEVWGCAVVGQSTYFICRDRLLRWDGSRFEITHHPGGSRLFPLTLAGETWLHHRESGLYRLTETGAKLELPSSQLPDSGILGVARDQAGLLLATGRGFYRPGQPAQPAFGAKLNAFITEAKLAGFACLPDGTYALGTLNEGIAVINATGELLRTLNAADGLPSRVVFSLSLDPSGFLWCVTPTGVFRFEALGLQTRYDAANGITGQGVDVVKASGSALYALNSDGIYSLVRSKPGGNRFERIKGITESYTHLVPCQGGLLLSRHGGLDFYDGIVVQPLFTMDTKGVFFAQPTRLNPDRFWLVESFGLAQLERRADGSFQRTKVLELPDWCNSVREDATGRLWIGTPGKGAFTFAAGASGPSPVIDPATGTPLDGAVFVQAAGQGVLVMHGGRALLAGPDGSELKVLEGLPPFAPISTRRVPGQEQVLIAFKRLGLQGDSAPGLAVLEIDGSQRAHWRELEVPSLGTIGFVRELEFSQENGRPILWLSGTEALLRLDYEAIPPLRAAEMPFVKLDTSRSRRPSPGASPEFPFEGHRVVCQVFAGDYSRSKDWRFQFRLGSGPGEWSAPALRRSFEFTNLSEGDYRFEARAVNAAGGVSDPAVLVFRILPPWYRSGWAYTGYAAGIVLAGLGLVHLRERRSRSRTRELEQQVASRTAELVKANAAKDEFLANVSHEIRNPMNGVIGIAESVWTEALDPDSKHKFGVLRQCASHLSSLLEDLLDFSRAQAGVVELDAKPFDVLELAESLVALTTADSQRRGIPVEVAISPAVPRYLVGDLRRVRQILLNFVGNALKFSGRGQVSVTVWRRGGDPLRPEVNFAVSDDGPGIAPEEKDRIFTRFERGAAAKRDRVPGTGLGLALCKGLAERMGGRVWLESEPGQGACFCFSATFGVAAAGATAAVVPAEAERKMRFALVVDDEEYNRLALTGLLESLDIIVQAAADGRRAVDLAGHHDFDVIFLDFAMPGLSGLEAARAIRALPGRSGSAAIVATTAFNSPEVRAQSQAAGMNAFLNKPVTMERLRQLFAALGGDGTPVETEAATGPSAPADPLANLRLLAGKKHVAFADERALFLTELENDFERLAAALAVEEAGEAGHYTHLLCGRCAFINERGLEHMLRTLEAAVGTQRWDESRSLARELKEQIEALRVRLASETADGPSA